MKIPKPTEDGKAAFHTQVPERPDVVNMFVGLLVRASASN
jgi:hypothetical protein